MSEPNAEKAHAVPDLHEFREDQGYILDASETSTDVKLAKDGHTVLIPQPSDDPCDPLNWSIARKHVVLVIMSAAAFLPDYGSATGMFSVFF